MVAQDKSTAWYSGMLRWFSPLRYTEDDEKDRRSVLLNTMLKVNVLMAVILDLTHIIFVKHTTGRFWEGLGLLVFFLLLFIPLRRGYIYATSNIFIFGMIFGLTLSVANTGTARSPLAYAYVLIVICSGLLQSLRYVILTIFLCALGMLGINMGEQHHLLPPPALHISTEFWFITMEIVCWVGWISHYTVKNLQQTRQRLRIELTEKDKMVANLKLSEEFLDNVFKCSPAAMTVNTLRENRLARVNDAFMQLMGYDKNELVGIRTDRLPIWENKEVRDCVQDKLRTEGELNNLPMRFRKKDGTFVSGIISSTIVELANQVVVVTGFVDLTERENAEKTRLDLERQLFEAQKEEIRADFDRMELKRARDLQLSLLPGVSFQYPPYVISSHSVTATQVGGDYYDYFALPSGRLVVVIGDVSGHGLPSGLLMAMVKSSLYSIVPDSPEIGKVLQTLNNIVRLGGVAERMFLTLCYLIFDPGEGLLSCSINGHPFPLVRKSDGTILELGESAYPLGIRNKPEIRIKQQALSAGDRILLYTDGIPEITNPDGKVFGYPAIQQYLAQSGHLPCAEIVAGLFEQVYAFASEQQQADDMTVLCVEVQEKKDDGHLRFKLSETQPTDFVDTTEVDLVIPIKQNMELTAMRVAETLAQTMQFTSEQRSEIGMALLEACVNAFEHSHAPDEKVYIKYIPQPGQLCIVLHDNGRGFDPARLEKPELSSKLLPGARKRGWGIQLMENLMDTLDIQTGEGGTTITMIKKLT